jgi:hypothetical protein
MAGTTSSLRSLHPRVTASPPYGPALAQAVRVTCGPNPAPEARAGGPGVLSVIEPVVIALRGSGVEAAIDQALMGEAYGFADWRLQLLDAVGMRPR